MGRGVVPRSFFLPSFIQPRRSRSVLGNQAIGSTHLHLHCTNLQHLKGSLLRHGGRGAGGRGGAGLGDMRSCPTHGIAGRTCVLRRSHRVWVFGIMLGLEGERVVVTIECGRPLRRRSTPMGQALVFGLIGSSALIIGGAIGAYWRVPQQFNGILLAFAGGEVLASLADTLMPEAFEHGRPLNSRRQWPASCRRSSSAVERHERRASPTQRPRCNLSLDLRFSATARRLAGILRPSLAERRRAGGTRNSWSRRPSWRPPSPRCR